MTSRHLLTTAVTALCAVALVACGGDDDAAPTTTANEEITTTSLSDGDYAERIDEAESDLVTAGSDLCELAEATSAVPPPANPEQVRTAIGLYRATYEAAAEALEPEDPTSAAALRDAVRDLGAAAEEADYAPELLTGENPPEALRTEEFRSALQAVQERYDAECTQAPAVPEGESPEGESPEGGTQAGRAPA
jgi:hypothetical protein